MVDAAPGARLDPRAPLRREGVAKLTGALQFTVDQHIPGVWHGVTVRATEPHARLLGIELDPSFDWSQVVLVTAADIPAENVVDGVILDQPALADGEIHHVTQAVALVAAPDAQLAEEARDRIRLRTEPLVPEFDPELGESFKDFVITMGNPDAGFAAADYILEGEYRTGHQEHLYLEPQAIIAVPRGERGVLVRGSIQNPYYVHAALVRALGFAPESVVVVAEETGGGFGGKEDIPSLVAIHAALLALKARRPVRLVYGRQEDVASSTKRHPSIIRHRTGVTRDGVLVAQDIAVVLDGGAFATVSPMVLERAGVHATGPYRCPNVRVRARAGRTNTPPSGAFRGFGAPQAAFAAETQLNRIAEALRISPVEIRRRNVYREGDVTVTGQLLAEHLGGADVLEAVADAADFERARAAAARRSDDRQRSGVGIALGWHGSGFTGSGEGHLASEASVEITADGVILGRCSATEMGQGARTVLAQVIADVLGVALDAVELARPDTSEVPDTGPTVASRTTMVAGAILAAASARLRATVEAATGRPFVEAYRRYAREHGPTRATEQFHGAPGTSWDEATCQGDAYPTFSWSAVMAAVDVDLDTGEVSVRSVIHAVDAGRIVNRVLATGQVEGGTLQAVGLATMESMQVRDGAFANDRFATYLVPTSLDAPAITTILVENPFTLVPHGARGLGELPMDAPAPAVVAAIQQAVGEWVTSLPATPERVLDIISDQEAPR